MAKCSVIIPTYNRAHLIEKALVSALAQTLDPIEILVMDDGSLDCTPYILEKFSRLHPNIRPFRHDTNQGISMARNELLDHVTGDFVYMLDSDNYILNDSILQTMYDKAISSNAEMLFSHRRVRYEGPAGCLAYDDQTIERHIFDKPDESQNLETMPPLIYATSSCNFFYSREFIVQHDIRFDDQLKRWEDVPFYTVALTKASRVTIWPETTRITRRHEGSVMKRYFGYANYRNRDEADVAMCLRGIDVIEDAFRDALKARPGLAVAHKNAQKLSLTSFGRLALGNLVTTAWARSETADGYRQRMRDIARNMTLEKSDFATDGYQRGKTADAAKRDFAYYQFIRDGRFEDAYDLLKSGGQPRRNDAGCLKSRHC